MSDVILLTDGVSPCVTGDVIAQQAVHSIVIIVSAHVSRVMSLRNKLCILSLS